MAVTLNPDLAWVFGSELDAVHLGPVGTPLPSSFDAALDAAFIHVGWLDENGIRESQTGSLTKVHGLTGHVLDVFPSESGLEYAFTAYESTGFNLGLRYEERNVSTVSGVRESDFGPGLRVSFWAAVIDLRDQSATAYGERLCFPRLAVSAAGERSATSSGITSIPLVAEVIGTANRRFVKSR